MGPCQKTSDEIVWADQNSEDGFRQHDGYRDGNRYKETHDGMSHRCKLSSGKFAYCSKIGSLNQQSIQFSSKEKTCSDCVIQANGNYYCSVTRGNPLKVKVETESADGNKIVRDKNEPKDFCSPSCPKIGGVNFLTNKNFKDEHDHTSIQRRAPLKTEFEFICADGYEVVDGPNKQTTTCQSTKQWTTNGGNLKPCTPQRCPPPDQPGKNYKIEELKSESEFYVHDSALSFTCEDGFVRLDDSTLTYTTKCDKGNWEKSTAEFPECVKKCSPPQQPGKDYEILTFDSTLYDPAHILTFTCKLGFARSDDKTTTTSATECDNGIWTNPTSEFVACIEKSCPAFGEFDYSAKNMKVVDVETKNVLLNEQTHGKIIIFKCLEEYKYFDVNTYEMEVKTNCYQGVWQINRTDIPMCTSVCPAFGISDFYTDKNLKLPTTIVNVDLAMEQPSGQCFWYRCIVSVKYHHLSTYSNRFTSN